MQQPGRIAEDRRLADCSLDLPGDAASNVLFCRQERDLAALGLWRTRTAGCPVQAIRPLLDLIGLAIQAFDRAWRIDPRTPALIFSARGGSDDQRRNDEQREVTSASRFKDVGPTPSQPSPPWREGWSS